VIQGIRLLPWFQEAIHRLPKQLEHLSDCGKCMQTQPRERRQLMGCGYEPSAPMASTVWQPSTSKLGYRHKRPTVCAGYLTRRPEVLEVARAHAHWEKGSLAVFCGDDKPSDEFLACIELLDAELAAVKSWMMTPKKDGGGRE
jgi:hypothetical protein